MDDLNLVMQEVLSKLDSLKDYLGCYVAPSLDVIQFVAEKATGGSGGP